MPGCRWTSGFGRCDKTQRPRDAQHPSSAVDGHLGVDWGSPMAFVGESCIFFMWDGEGDGAAGEADQRQRGELSLHLRASEVLLLPFTDGMSRRRTTLMAGLAHGLPVIRLQGVNTDSILIQHTDAMVLTPSGDADAYAHATVRLILDPAGRQAVGRARRSLYERNFDWPVLAQMVLNALSDASAAPRAS